MRLEDRVKRLRRGQTMCSQNPKIYIFLMASLIGTQSLTLHQKMMTPFDMSVLVKCANFVLSACLSAIVLVFQRRNCFAGIDYNKGKGKNTT